MFHSVALFISVEVSWIWKSISTADGRPESVSDLVFRFWLPSDVLWAVYLFVIVKRREMVLDKPPSVVP